MIIEDKKTQAEYFKYFQFLYQATNMKSYCNYPPHQFYVEPTNRCNLKCQMCVQDKMARAKGYMELDLMKKIIDEVSEFDPFFDFCRQGEPLIHPQLVEMIEYAINKGLTKTRLITNATLLRKNISARLIKSGLRKINISFNGYDRESYERIQKGAGFDRTLRNLFNFLKLKIEINSRTPHVEISMVEYQNLKEKFNQFFELFKKLPVERIRVSKLINFFGSNEDKVLEENIKKEYKEWPSCKVPFRFFNINWNGDVSPCIIDYDSKYIVGNVSNCSVLEVWNNEKMKFFRDCHINKKFDDISRNSKGVFCGYCSNLWSDPNTNGPQYPYSFDQGATDFFQKDSRKTMAGKFESDLFRSEEEIEILKKRFLKDFDLLYHSLIARA